MNELQSFSTLIPHEAYSAMDVFQYRLYAHYQRVCQEAPDGLCRESNQQSAQVTKMSASKVSATRQWLIDNEWVFPIYGEYQQDIVTVSCVPPTNYTPQQRQDVGYVYLMDFGGGYYKIGKSKNPEIRRAAFQAHTPHPVTIVYTAQFNKCNIAERFLHRNLTAFRYRGEWYQLLNTHLEWITSGEWLDDSQLRGECLGETRRE